MRPEDLLTEREEFLRLLQFNDDDLTRPIDCHDDPITMWGMGLCRLHWAEEMTDAIASLREHVMSSTNPMKTLSDMRRLPFRFGALWTNRNRDLHDATLRDMFRMVMERPDVGIDVRSMCLTYLIQREDEDVAALLETAWEWLQETNDPNLIDVVWTHRNDIPIIQEWLDARRFDRVEVPVAPTTEIIHRVASDGVLDDNIYTDSQSVHTSTATQDFYESIARLLEEDNPRDTDPYNYAVSAMIDDNRLFSDRILHDPTVFRSTNKTIRLVDIFGIVHRAALRYGGCALDRLAEEIDEANGTCSSGHAFRMVNALAGIHPGVRMRVSIESQVRVYLQNTVRTMATDDGLCWFEGDEFHAWVAHRLPHLIDSFIRHDKIGGRRLWLSEWARLFPTCKINPFTLVSFIIRYPISIILHKLRPRR